MDAGPNLPAVKGNLVATQMQIAVWEYLGHLPEQQPQMAVGGVLHRVQGAQLTRGVPLGVKAGGQQLRVPFAPGCNMT